MGAVLSVGRRGKKKKMRMAQEKRVPIASKSESIASSGEYYDQSDTGEESSDFNTTQGTTVSEEMSDEKSTENRTHSSDTSYGVESLPEIEDYAKWRKNYAKDDENWVRAVTQFNDRWPTHRRQAKPAKLVRRIIVPYRKVGWTKAAREVYKRQDIEWEIDEDREEDTLSSLSIHTFGSDSLDESSIESRDRDSEA